MPNLGEASRDPIMVLHQMAAPRHPPNMIFQKDKMEFRFLDKMKFRFLDKMKFRFLDKKEFRFLDEMEFIFVDKMRFIFSYKIELIIYENGLLEQTFLLDISWYILSSETLYMYIYMKKYEFCYICVQIQYLDSFHECLHACIWMKLCCLTNLYSHHCILPLFTTLTSVFLELGTRRLIVKLHIMFIQCLYGKFGRKSFCKIAWLNDIDIYIHPLLSIGI